MEHQWNIPGARRSPTESGWIWLSAQCAGAGQPAYCLSRLSLPCSPNMGQLANVGQCFLIFLINYEKSVDIHVRFWVSISFFPEEKRFSSWSWDSKQHDSMWQEQQQTILEYREKVWNWGKLRIVNLLPWASWSLDLVAHHVMSTRSVIHRNSGNTTIAGTKHPFAGYFYVHQGYRVLTRP